MKEKTAEPKTHSKYAPSSAYRWLECPGSVTLIEQCPPQKDSAASIEGTTAHEYLEGFLRAKYEENTLTNFLKKDAKKYPIEMRDYITPLLKKVDELFEPEVDELIIEEKVKLTHIHPEFSGTLDAGLAKHYETLHIWDLKYGFGKVEANQNSQGAFYALGAARKFNYDFKNVEISIFQPRAPDKGNPFRTWKLSMKELRRWEDIFKRAIEATIEKPDVFKAGDHCGYCPAAQNMRCPALNKRAKKIADRIFDEAPEISVEIDGKKYDAKVTKDILLPVSPNAEYEITPEKLRLQLDMIPSIETWIKGLEAYAQEFLEKGGKIPGYELVPKRAQRVWSNPKKALKLALLEFGSNAINEELKSPAQMEKLGYEGMKEFITKHSASVSSGMKIERKK
jgi:hypothetical protein